MSDDDTYTAEEVDAAVLALADPDRFRHAQDVITHAAPGLQSVLDSALEEGGWFGGVHEAQIAEAAGHEQPAQRSEAVRRLVAEETRLSMLVGVTVGFELARELAAARLQDGGTREPG